MAEPTIVEYLNYAKVQMAAEALYGFNATRTGADLQPGDLFHGDIPVGILTDGNLHASKFTIAQATDFASQWKVIEHKSNTATGFSGTLFENEVTHELVLSFRSTEFIDDAARDNEATNVLEIKDTGWAFGQISDMEDWYQSLVANNLITGPLTVTGYSLGGHLATAFNLMHGAAVQRVITFNGAGVGKIGDGTLATTQQQLPQMIAWFSALRAQGETAAGLEDQLQSTEGKAAYRSLENALAETGKDQALESDGARFALGAGMQVGAEVHLGTRSILEYLLSPVQRAFHEAGRER